MTRRNLPEENRRAMIIDAAVRLANEHGLALVTQESVAERCMVPCSPRTVRRIFPQVTDLWRAVAAENGATKRVKDDARVMGI